MLNKMQLSCRNVYIPKSLACTDSPAFFFAQSGYLRFSNEENGFKTKTFELTFRIIIKKKMKAVHKILLK